jgi:hypothetical protein
LLSGIASELLLGRQFCAVDFTREINSVMANARTGRDAPPPRICDFFFRLMWGTTRGGKPSHFADEIALSITIFL